MPWTPAVHYTLTHQDAATRLTRLLNARSCGRSYRTRVTDQVVIIEWRPT